MRRACTLSLAALCALTLAVAGPSTALAASAFELVQADYLKHFAVTPCKFTPKQLQEAKTTIPNDYAQYAPDFQDAIDAAAKQRASGACGKKTGTDKQATPAAPAGPSTGGTPPPAAPKAKAPATPTTPAVTTGSAAAPTPQPTPSVTPAPAVADGAILAAARNTDSDSDLPAPLLALALLALLAALAGVAVMTTRWLAVEPRWVVRSRHATAEAGWRTSAAWAEFRDWLRLGR